MPAAIPRKAATRSSPRPISRCGSDALKRAGLTVNPARIEGGEPEQCRARQCRAARQHAPAHARDQAAAKPRSTRRWRRSPPSMTCRSSVHGGFARPPKPLDARGRRAVRSGEASRRRPRPGDRLAASGGVCDGNNIAACGVPVVDTMGVRGGAIHSMEEYLIVESLAERARLVGAHHPAPGERGA